MKTQITLILIFLSLCSFGQSNLSDITKRASVIRTPYSTIQYGNKAYLLSSKILLLEEIKLVLKELEKTKQTIVNPRGGTAFGDLDSPHFSSNTLGLEDVKQIKLIGIVKGSNYSLLHLQVTYNYSDVPNGILIALDKASQITGWMFSDGCANGGNPNGNILRDVTLKKSALIEIEESSWGRNTESYSMKSTYSLVHVGLLSNKTGGGPKFKLLKRKFT